MDGRPHYRFVHGDIADGKVVAALMAECDYVVNFAAETHVDRSIHDADDFIRTDVYGTFVLLEAFRGADRPRRFVQISTDEVYGASSPAPLERPIPSRPATPTPRARPGRTASPTRTSSPMAFRSS